MVIRVPRSWSAPHRVVYLKDMNFYERNPTGKHPMSLGELRSAFVLSASIADRMRAFGEERLSAFGSLPFHVQPGPKSRSSSRLCRRSWTLSISMSV